VDVRLAAASKRDERRYAARPVDPEVARRILEAGRVTSSARNGQPWSFVVIARPETREEAAASVYLGRLVRDAGLAVALAVRPRGGLYLFDAGRAAQQMMLVAWGEGLISCPNGVADPDRLSAALGLDPDERPVVVLTFGHPERPHRPERRSPEEWTARAQRRPYDDVVREA
jgi:nitroreductase